MFGVRQQIGAPSGLPGRNKHAYNGTITNYIRDINTMSLTCCKEDAGEVRFRSLHIPNCVF